MYEKEEKRLENALAMTSNESIFTDLVNKFLSDIGSNTLLDKITSLVAKRKEELRIESIKNNTKVIIHLPENHALHKRHNGRTGRITEKSATTAEIKFEEDDLTLVLPIDFLEIIEVSKDE